LVEALAPEGIQRDLVPQELERHGAVELPVPGVVDDGGRPFPDALADLVAGEAGVLVEALLLLLEEPREVLGFEPAPIDQDLAQQELPAVLQRLLLEA